MRGFEAKQVCSNKADPAVSVKRQCGPSVCLVVNLVLLIVSQWGHSHWMLRFSLCFYDHSTYKSGMNASVDGEKRCSYFGFLLNRLHCFHSSMQVQPRQARETNAVYRQRPHGPRQPQPYLPHSQKVKVETGWEIIYRALSATAAAAWLMISHLCPSIRST